ncbi:MAG TPA: hypothetical protein P5543_07490 [Planctomycetota bacterium]|nr:hypothetical protein [Planctomycetota bacterium]
MAITFDRFRMDTRVMSTLGIAPTVQEAFLNSKIEGCGCWLFTKDEIELLNLYCREGLVQGLCNTSLSQREDEWITKGSNYFKIHSKKYGHRNFSDFVEELLNLITRFYNTVFEPEDAWLQRKVLLILTEELLNHFAWGMYIAYIGGGLCDGILLKGVSYRGISKMQGCFLYVAKLYMDLFQSRQPAVGDWINRIRIEFSGSDWLNFITQANDLRKKDEGLYFRLRNGSNELKNATNALGLKLQTQPNEYHGVIAPFYSSLTAAALMWATLCIDGVFCVHAYSNFVDHVPVGEWYNKSERDITQRWNKIPILVRPDRNVHGKKLILVDYSYDEVKTIYDLLHFYTTFGAKVACCVVELGQAGVWDGLDFEPLFLAGDPGYLRRRMKEVMKEGV